MFLYFAPPSFGHDSGSGANPAKSELSRKSYAQLVPYQQVGIT